jgi:hypothetical protein
MIKYYLTRVFTLSTMIISAMLDSATTNQFTAWLTCFRPRLVRCEPRLGNVRSDSCCWLVRAGTADAQQQTPYHGASCSYSAYATAACAPGRAEPLAFPAATKASSRQTNWELAVVVRLRQEPATDQICAGRRQGRHQDSCRHCPGRPTPYRPYDGSQPPATYTARTVLDQPLLRAVTPDCPDLELLLSSSLRRLQRQP